MTAKQQFELYLGQAEKNQVKGRKVLTFVYAINRRKLAAAEIDEADLMTILQDVNLMNIERLLLNGSIETARALIVSSTFDFYDQQDKDLILNVIDNEVFTNY